MTIAAAPPSPLRLRCSVPFCTRTRGRWKGEPPISADMSWICGDHWRLVPVYMRRRHSRLLRLYTKRYGRAGHWDYPPGSPDRIGALRLARVLKRAWGQCERAAIEAAVGL